MAFDYVAGTSVQGGAIAPQQRAPDLGLDEVAATFNAIAADQRRQAEAARAREAEAQAFKTGADLQLAAAKWVDERTRAAGPGAAGLADGIAEGWDGFVKPYLDEAPAAVRPYLDRIALRLRNETLLDAFGYERKASEVNAKRVTGQALSTLANAVRSNPALYRSAVGQGLAALETAGLDPLTAEELKAAWQSDAAVAYAQGLGDRDPYALKRALMAGELDNVLDPDKKNTLLNGAEADIERAEREAEARQREAERQAEQNRRVALGGLKARMEDALASLGVYGEAPGAPGYQEVLQIAGPEAAEAWRQDTALAGELYRAIDGLSELPPEQVRAQVMAWKPQPGDADFAAKTKRWQAVATQAEAMLKLRAEDPAAAARLAGGSGTVSSEGPDGEIIVTRADPLRAQDAETQAAMVAAQQAAQEAGYDRIGLPADQRRVLTLAEAKGFAGQLSDEADPLARANRVRALAGVYGERWPSVAAEIAREAGDPGVSTLLAAADDPALLQAVAGGLAIAKTAEGTMTKDQTTALGDTLSQTLAPLKGALGIRPETQGQLAQLEAVAQAVAIGEVAKGFAPDEAARRAGAIVMKDWISGSGIVVPAASGLDPDEAAAAVSQAVLAIPLEGLYAPAGASEDDRWSIHDALRTTRGLTLRVYGKSEGLEAVGADGQVVKRADGSRVRFTWDEIKALQAAGVPQGTVMPFDPSALGFVGLP